MADFKFGRKPPKNAPALRLASMLTGVVPAHPVAVDYLSRLSNWQILGNDRYGDCVSVMVANNRRLTTAVLGGAEKYWTQQQVYDFYKTQNPEFPSQDDGMDIQTALEYLSKTGGPDGVKAIAFAKVDAHNLAEMDAAIAIFGSVMLGVDVLEANMDQFDAGEPWDYVVGSAYAGGHGIEAGGYASLTPQSDVRFITWGQETSFTDAFVAHQFSEAWVVVWPEHLGSVTFQQGIDMAALASAYTSLTGRPFPVVLPPTPTPIPAPVSADAAFAAVLKPWVAARHSGTNAVAAKAAKRWLSDKGL